MSGAIPWSRYKATLRRAQNGELEHADEGGKRKAIEDLIEMASVAATALALQPFPGVDSALVGPIQTRMIVAIARVHGYRLDPSAPSRDILAPLGEQLVISHLTIAAAKLLPFLDLFGTAMVYGLMSATGDVSAEYYRRGRSMNRREMKARFRATYRRAYEKAFNEKRDDLRALFREPQVREQIRDLKRARCKGTLGADEVAARIDQLLREKP
jgi:uncharacterized protein (DUF697 family)